MVVFYCEKPTNYCVLLIPFVFHCAQFRENPKIRISPSPLRKVQEFQGSWAFLFVLYPLSYPLYLFWRFGAVSERFNELLHLVSTVLHHGFCHMPVPVHGESGGGVPKVAGDGFHIHPIL